MDKKLRDFAQNDPDLRVLHEAGLLEREQRGVWAYYRLVPGRLQLLCNALTAGAANG